MISTTDRQIVQRLVAAAAQGQIGQAFPLLREAAASGNALAAATVAEWRMAGDLVRRDLAEACHYYGVAARLGLAEAEPIHIALLASGAGNVPRDWDKALGLLRQRARRDPLARRQMELLQAMDLSPDGTPGVLPVAEDVCTNPLIRRISNFMTVAECRYLIARATPLLQPSQVIHPQTGRLIIDPVRRARSMSFVFVLEDPALHAISRRIMAALGVPYANGEPLQVLNYRPGEEYRLHSDALPPGGPQREWTFLVWLNDGYTGGATAFPQVPLELRGAVGDAVIFRNIDDSGKPLDRARHSGNPVMTGEKFLLSKWVRNAPMPLDGPPGRPF